MSAYRYETGDLVDAEPAPPRIRVLCGPLHSSETRTLPGDWIVLTPKCGYEVWPNAGFAESFCECTRRSDKRELDEALRTCGLERVRELIAEGGSEDADVAEWHSTVR